MKHLVVSAWAIVGATQFANAQFTFAPQVQSTNTASITHNSGTGYFQYTDAANPSDDFAGLILTGNAGSLISTSNGWTASLTVNLSARSMPGNGSAVNVAMGLYVLINGNDSDSVKISLDQEDNTGSGEYNNFWGTAVVFEAVTNSQNLATTPLAACRTWKSSFCLEPNARRNRG